MNEPADPDRKESKMQTEEPAPSAPPVRKLIRNTDDKMIGGVASGLAAYFGIDTVLVRIAFVALVVLGGTGVLLYLLLWLLMPADPDQPSAGEAALSKTRNWPAWLGVVLIVIAVAAIADGFHWWEPELVWGLGLVALGVYLLRREEPPPAQGRSEPAPGGAGATSPSPPSDATEAAPVLKRRRSALAPLTLGAALLATGTAVILDNLFDAIEMNPGRYFALAFAIVGLGLVAGAWWGRSPGLIVLGVALAPMVFFSGLSTVPLEGGAGERFYQPLSIEGIRDEYRLGAGTMTLDLSDVRFEDESVEVEASVAMGELIVIVPDGVSVDVTGVVGAGELRAFGVIDEGLDLDVTTGIQGGTEGHLLLDVGAGLGSVEVRQAQPFEEAQR